MFRLINTSVAMVIVLFCSGVKAQPGGSLFELHCASCHGNPPAGSRAPDRETLRQLTPERVLESLTTGAMSVAVPGLSDEQRRQVAQWAAGRALGTSGGAALHRCPISVRVNRSTLLLRVLACGMVGVQM